MKLVLKKASLSLLNLLFPPLCLHCEEKMPSALTILCPACVSLLTPITVEGRCLRCFRESHSTVCEKCRVPNLAFTRLASCCDYQGPASALVHHLKYSHRSGLAKTLASLMVVQLIRLDWPLPDFLIPVPQSFMHRLSRGYNQSQLIAQEMSKLLNIPTYDCLKRSPDAISQTALNRKQREQLSHQSILLKHSTDIADKTVLLIDDVMTTRSTLSVCAHALTQAYPTKIYGLTFCSA